MWGVAWRLIIMAQNVSREIIRYLGKPGILLLFDLLWIIYIKLAGTLGMLHTTLPGQVKGHRTPGIRWQWGGWGKQHPLWDIQRTRGNDEITYHTDDNLWNGRFWACRWHILLIWEIKISLTSFQVLSMNTLKCNWLLMQQMNETSIQQLFHIL